MSHVMYNSKRLIPAPFVTATKTYQNQDDGVKVGSQWDLTINGTIVAWMGSPASSGTFWTLGGFPPDETIQDSSMFASIIRKQEAIRELFSIDGQELEFQAEDGSQPMKCNPKITGITFNEGTWYDRLTYTITCTAPILSVNGQDVGEDNFPSYVESASESWQIETNEEPEAVGLPRTYRLTHTVNAKGKLVYNSDGTQKGQPWEQARLWVLPKLGLDNSIVASSGVTDLPSYYGGYNHLRSENIDKRGGSYAVTETWLLTSGNALETYEISTSTSYDTYLTKVAINGNITGLEVRNNDMSLNTLKYTNALSKWTNVSGLLLSRAQSYAGTTLNVIPVSTQVSQSPAVGTISYNYEFDNRPSNIIPQARSEVVTVTDNLPTDFCVPIFVLGRTLGPVLQNLNTSKERTRTLAMELAMPLPSGSASDMINGNPRVSASTSGNVEGIISSAKPVGTSVFVQDRQETWDIKTGRYTYNTTWIWEP